MVGLRLRYKAEFLFLVDLEEALGIGHLAFPATSATLRPCDLCDLCDLRDLRDLRDLATSATSATCELN
jgi:hypothetical protein